MQRIFCGLIWSFTLFAKLSSQTVNDHCENALPLVAGISYELTTPPEFYNYEFCENYFNRSFWFKLPKGNPTLELVFEDSTNYKNILFAKGNCDSLVCLGKSYIQNKIHLNPNTDFDIYVIVQYDPVAFTFPGKIYVNPITTGANDHCINSKIIQCEDIILDTIQTSSLSFEDPSYFIDYINSDVWYKLEGENKGYSIVSDTNQAFYLTCYESKVGCSDLTLLTGENFANASVEKKRLNIGKRIGYHYYIKLSYADDFISRPVFKARVECFDKPVNDDCENAIELKMEADTLTAIFKGCSKDTLNCTNEPGIWYKVSGNDSLFLLSGIGYKLFKGSCENYECYDNYMPNRKFLKKGEEYLIYTYGYNFEARTFSYKKYAPQPNSFCNNSYEFSLGVPLKINPFLYIYGDKDSCSRYYPYSSSWFHFRGDGEAYLFTKSNYINGASNMIFYNSCDSLCWGQMILNFYPTNATIFQTQKDQSYKINLNELSPFDIEYDLMTQKTTAYKNISFETADSLKCQQYQLEYSKFAYSFDNKCSPVNSRNNPSIYYVFKGENDFVKITGDLFGLSIIDTSCHVLKKLEFPLDSFYTEKDNIYYLKVDRRDAQFVVNNGCLTNTKEPNKSVHKISILPNPLDSKAILYIESDVDKIADINIYNNLGVLETRKLINVYSGKNEIALFRAEFKNPGMYFINVQFNGISHTLKLVVI